MGLADLWFWGFLGSSAPHVKLQGSRFRATGRHNQARNLRTTDQHSSTVVVADSMHKGCSVGFCLGYGISCICVQGSLS